MPKTYVVSLARDERKQLLKLVRGGGGSAKALTHTRILLKADCAKGQLAWTDKAISDALDVGVATVERIRQIYVRHGLEAAVKRRARSREPARRLNGKQEAHLIALACSKPPSGRDHWTLLRLANRMVELEYADELSQETVRRTLKKRTQAWLKKEGCIPPQANGVFIAQMEEVLDLYEKLYDSHYPLVCMDETSKQLMSEMQPPLPSQPGQTARQDYAYERNGVCKLFLCFEPLQSRRHVRVADQRTVVDWVPFMRDVAQVHFPDAQKIVALMDNLNTHGPGSFHEAFAPAEAKRLAARFEFHYTPKHGSWLNMAEIELSALSRMRLERRIPDKATLAHKVATWESERNAKSVTVAWRFTTTDARIKLKKLYPVISV